MSKWFDFFGYLIAVLWVTLMTSFVFAKEFSDFEAYWVSRVLYVTTMLLLAVLMVKAIDLVRGENEPAT